jgi:RNA polymerase sigma-70 factor (ECF subfamily)
MPEDDELLLSLVQEIQSASEGLRERAFTRLDRQIRPIGARFFRKKSFSPEEVEDLNQETMLRVYNGLKDFRRESSFRVWFFEILANVFRNEIRRRRSAKREGWESSLDAPPSPVAWEGGGVPARDLRAEEPDPLDELLRSEGRERFRVALEELPAQMRRVCLLRYLQGWKYREIASLLGISIETVKAHLHQAKKRLTERLGGDAQAAKPRE